jgi:hypothetical protein
MLTSWCSSSSVAAAAAAAAAGHVGVHQVLPDLLTELDGMDQRQRLLALVQVGSARGAALSCKHGLLGMMPPWTHIVLQMLVPGCQQGHTQRYLGIINAPAALYAPCTLLSMHSCQDTSTRQCQGSSAGASSCA